MATLLAMFIVCCQAVDLKANKKASVGDPMMLTAYEPKNQVKTKLEDTSLAQLKSYTNIGLNEIGKKW